MAEAIVHRLEVIDVDHETRQRRALTATSRELFVQARLQIAAVVPTGQHVRETAADEPRAVHGAFERERGDDRKVMEKLRAERRLESFALAATEIQATDQTLLARKRQQGHALQVDRRRE
jgi:hypothetical protein